MKLDQIQIECKSPVFVVKSGVRKSEPGCTRHVKLPLVVCQPQVELSPFSKSQSNVVGVVVTGGGAVTCGGVTSGGRITWLPLPEGYI